MNDMNTIIIADDHPLLRKGLLQILSNDGRTTVIEAENGEEAIAMIREKKPSVAILDIEMPKMTGFDVARRVNDESLPVSIIFLTMYREEQVFNKAMDIGVKGYVLKENAIAEIQQCIAAVMDGKHYLSPSLSDYLIRRNARFSSPSRDTIGLSLLTAAERNVLKLVAEMKTNREIADILSISTKTVHNHRNNICNKLGLQGAHALLKFALEYSKQI